MLKIEFSVECPYCGATQEKKSMLTDSDVVGDWADPCEECEKRFLIHWEMFVDAAVHKISEPAPPVRCSATLESHTGLYEDDDEDDDIGIDA
jgi:hypothetical protein